MLLFQKFRLTWYGTDSTIDFKYATEYLIVYDADGPATPYFVSLFCQSHPWAGFNTSKPNSAATGQFLCGKTFKVRCMGLYLVHFFCQKATGGAGFLDKPLTYVTTRLGMCSTSAHLHCIKGLGGGNYFYVVIFEWRNQWQECFFICFKPANSNAMLTLWTADVAQLLVAVCLVAQQEAVWAVVRDEGRESRCFFPLLPSHESYRALHSLLRLCECRRQRKFLTSGVVRETRVVREDVWKVCVERVRWQGTNVDGKIEGYRSVLHAIPSCLSVSFSSG